VNWLTANRIITIGGEQMALLDKLKQIWVSEKIPAYEKQASLTDEGRQKKIMSLTPREHDLFLLLLEGFTLKESAKQLSVKYSTANTHMTSIYKKLNVNSRAELIINYHDIGGKYE
jgi:DNA-binding CsgD family transcriptional regulator